MSNPESLNNVCAYGQLTLTLYNRLPMPGTYILPLSINKPPVETIDVILTSTSKAPDG